MAQGQDKSFFLNVRNTPKNNCIIDFCEGYIKKYDDIEECIVSTMFSCEYF